MNKDHWNTIILDGNLSKETIDDMTGRRSIKGINEQSISIYILNKQELY